MKLAEALTNKGQWVNPLFKGFGQAFPKACEGHGGEEPPKKRGRVAPKRQSVKQIAVILLQFALDLEFFEKEIYDD